MKIPEAESTGPIRGYADILRERSSEVSDEHKESMKALPGFYLLCCNIIGDPRCPWPAKMLINAALSYFVLEEDVISDRLKDGYVDDLFVCVHVLKEIRDKVSVEIIINNVKDTSLPEDEDELFPLIFDVYSEVSTHLGKKRDAVLKKVGLDQVDSFDLLYSEETARKITNRRRKVQLLYSMLAVKAHEVFANPPTRSFKRIERIREYLEEHAEYGEIKRYEVFLDGK